MLDAQTLSAFSAAGGPLDLFFAKADIRPALLCYHTPETVRKVWAEAWPPWAAAGLAADPDGEAWRDGGALQVPLRALFDPVPEAAGLHPAEFRCGVLCYGPGGESGWTPLPAVPRAVPAHFCYAGPFCGESAYTNDVFSGGPWWVPNPEDPETGEPEGTETRGPAVLVVGGGGDPVPAGLPPPGEPWIDACPVCGCVATNAPDTASAGIWRLTPDLAVEPASLPTSGVFTVTGAGPSTNFSSGVFAYRVGSRYSRGRYTVVGISNFLASAGGPVKAEPWPKIALGVPSALTLWTGVRLPSGTVTLELLGTNLTVMVKNFRTRAYEPLVSGTNALFSCDAADWRTAYCDTNLYADAYVVGTGIGRCALVHGYEGSGGGVDVACDAVLTLDVVRLTLAPDYADDGAIDAADVAAAGSNTVFRVWINDDGDVGDTTDEGGTDIPGQTGSAANGNDVAVNGRRDLPDFFPVMVDIGGVESVIGSDDLSYRIKQAGGAVNVVYTKLGNLNAGAFLTGDVSNCGPGLDTAARSAVSLSVASSGDKIVMAHVGRGVGAIQLC